MANVDFVKKTEELLAPARALNELTLSNMDRLVDMQLESTRKYASVVLDSLKDAGAVKDAEGAKSFLLAQVEAARKTGESLVADGQAVAKLGQEYVVEMQKIVKDSLASLPKVAAV